MTEKNYITARIDKNLPQNLRNRLKTNDPKNNDIPNLDIYPETKRRVDATPDSHPVQLANNDPFYLKFWGIILTMTDPLTGEDRSFDYVPDGWEQTPNGPRPIIE